MLETNQARMLGNPTTRPWNMGEWSPEMVLAFNHLNLVFFFALLFKLFYCFEFKVKTMGNFVQKLLVTTIYNLKINLNFVSKLTICVKCVIFGGKQTNIKALLFK